jgi:hypothetical protein
MGIVRMTSASLALHARRLGPAHGVVVCLCLCCTGCGGSGAKSEPESKVRLNKLLRLYQLYVEKNKNGPPSEQALREFGQKLSAKERDESLIGDDLDNIFTSPRDNQKYVIRYNLKLQQTGPVRAVAWEAGGQGGKRFVALSIGYVEEYDEETLKTYTK